MTKFIKNVCNNYASVHSSDIAEYLENSEIKKTTPELLLNVFKDLHKSKQYRGMTDLVIWLYDCTEKFYPQGAVTVQKYDFALKFYCDSFIKHFKADIKIVTDKLSG